MDDNAIEKLKRQYESKKVLIVGLGLQGGGVGLAQFFAELGADVSVTDKKDETELKPSLEKLGKLQVKYTLGGHKLQDFLNANIIFKGPSVPWDMPEIIEAQKKGIPIEMELSFFVKMCPSKNIIGVTGTRGKSTTTMMIYKILEDQGQKVFLGGNIPNTSTVSYLKNIKIQDFIVLELSSWNLSGFHKERISPHIALITNFYPDHLNYYKSLEDYLWDKKAIYLYQRSDDYLILNNDFKDIIRNDKINSKIIFFSKNDFREKLYFLKGNHNLENAAAAFKLAEILNIDIKKAPRTIANFKGLPYRQEIVGEKDGVIFVNDTTSTTPIATEKAIQTFANTPMVLILGGNTKSLPFSNLLETLNKVKRLILLKGTFTDEILPFLRTKYHFDISKVCDSLLDAVEKAYCEAKNLRSNKSKAVVLFSPAATSFSMFQNEFHRGSEFNRIVKDILNHASENKN